MGGRAKRVGRRKRMGEGRGGCRKEGNIVLAFISEKLARIPPSARVALRNLAAFGFGGSRAVGASPRPRVVAPLPPSPTGRGSWHVAHVPGDHMTWAYYGDTGKGVSTAPSWLPLLIPAAL